MNDAVTGLGQKRVAYAFNKCCEVPLAEENPDCWRHGYRSLMSRLAELELPEEVCAHALKVETNAMAQALDFFKRSALFPRYTELGSDHPGFAVLEDITADLNRLLDQIQRG